jgi:hypothetical protein
MTSSRPALAALALGSGLALVACGRSKVDESRARPPVAHDAASVLRALDATPGVHVRFEGRLTTIERGLAYVAPSAAPHPAAGSEPSGEGELAVVLPKDGAGATRVALGGDDAFSLEIAPETATARAGQLEGTAVVLLDAALDTDVVHVAGPGRAEELRLLRTPRASARARYVLRLGAHAKTARVVGDVVEILDAAGVPRITSAPMFAVDAAGVRRPVHAHLEAADGGTFTLETELDTRGLAYPIVVDPAWVATGDMVDGYRYLHRATLIASGKVLIFGGYVPGSGIDLSTAELYDPATRTWAATGSLTVGRQYHTVGTLTDGRVITVGGRASSAVTASVEIYAPATGTWSTVAPMAAGRMAPGMAILGDGRVLVAGGNPWSTATLATAEIYTPSTNTWAPTTSLNTPRAGYTDPVPSIVLGSGKVLVLGGSNYVPPTTTNLSTAEVYDPTAKTWTATSTPMHGTNVHALLLSSGKVLVATTEGNIDVYDPATNAFTAAAVSPVGQPDTFTQLSTGKVLCTAISGKYAIYDPATDSWSAAGDMLLKRMYASATRLASGSVLVAGGGYIPTLAPLAEVFTQGANGVACTGGYECTSGFCTDGVCCPVASCGAGKSCNAGTPGVCAKTVGVACGAAGECGSGFCVDGVCCGTACTGVCGWCNLAGKIGTCSAVSGAPAAGHGSCTGAGVGTVCAPSCNGVDATKCNYAAAGVTPCGADACATGVETHAGSCDGAGACGTTSKACGAYACGTTACKTTCATTADCAAGYACKSGACLAPTTLGSACTTGAECASGLFCTDGVCCGVASCGAGRSCAVGAAPGTCATVAGEVCTADAECGSTHCADGVCCDKACDGQCEACDVAGKKGACTPIAGAPHGGRKACDDGGGDACKATTCDGAKDTKTCAGFVNGATTQCKPATCAAASYTAPSTCDGAGACATPKASACFPYGCDDEGCLAACTSSAQCADGADCKDGKCASLGDTCSSDGLSSIAKGGAVTSCTPFRCGPDGKCISSCGTSADCAPGASCSEAKTCATDAGTDDGGGCNVSARSEGAGSGGWLAAGLGVLGACALVSRRRRARIARGREERA